MRAKTIRNFRKKLELNVFDFENLKFENTKV